MMVEAETGSDATTCQGSSGATGPEEAGKDPPLEASEKF